jgi:hypothetical protein
MTAVPRDIWSAAQFNVHVRDNLLETMTGKATTAGGYFVTTAAGAIAQRVTGSAAVATSQTRSHTAYGDLTTAGPAVTVTTGTEALVWLAAEAFSDGAPDSPDVSATTTYTATGSATYQSDGTNRGDGTRMYQGQFDATNGNQFSMALFPYATMLSDLTDATIVSCELFLDNDHFYLNAGGNAIIGTHNQTSLSGSHVYSQVTSALSSEHWDKGEAAYKFIDESVAERIRDGLAKGIALGKGPSSSLNYYGYFKGGTSPKLRIKYTKPGASGAFSKASFAVSGASTIAVSDNWGIYWSGAAANNSNRWGVARRVTGLTPGSNTFTMKYASGGSGATSTFARRELIVMPL